MSRTLGEDPLVEFCRALPGATEDVKWGNNLIFSVGGKMFAGFDLPDGLPFGFKVEPVLFEGLIRRKGIKPAPYLARHHWISITARRALTRKQLEELHATVVLDPDDVLGAAAVHVRVEHARARGALR